MQLFNYKEKVQQLPRSFKTPEGAVLPLRKHFEQGIITLDELADYGFTPYVAPEPSLPTVEERAQQLDQSVRQHIDDRVHWTAGPKLFDNAKANKPLSKEFVDWTEACWDDFEAKITALSSGTPWADAMLIFPAAPNISVLAARKE